MAEKIYRDIWLVPTVGTGIESKVLGADHCTRSPPVAARGRRVHDERQEIGLCKG